jgi:hypothetical protein
MLILGYDPGGKGANGVALLHVPEGGSSPEAWVHICNSVEQALAWVERKMSEGGWFCLDAAGIDTYLSWSTEPSGWRPMDIFLRQNYPRVEKSVFSSNSAYGSMAVQGMAMALRLRQLWPDIRLNETHPKVLYHALSGRMYSFGRVMTEWLLGQFAPPLSLIIYAQHQWDALLSTVATWKGIRELWTRDLMEGHENCLLCPAGAVTYYWP